MAQDRFNNIAASSTPGTILGRAAGFSHNPLLLLGLLAAALLLTSLLAPTPVRADPGVAMVSGNIIVDEDLIPGHTYHLPSITITNSGDEPGDYVMVLSYRLGRAQRSIPAQWITFDPQRFLLTPQKSQDVAVILSIPEDGFRPGDYFAYIESHQVSQVTGDLLGTAIATRLGFTLPASGWVSASVEEVRTFSENNSDWGYIIMALLLGPVLFYSFHRFVKIRIQVRRR